ncbi:MAG: TRAP transporter substrate-binding protein [Firmicutes bacterium]|nr:TRAP transporter substrate-binding protein [Bacillota bacterium]
MALRKTKGTRLCLLLLGLLMALSLGSSAKQVYHIKMGHVEPMGTPLDQGWNVFKQYVEAESGGRIKVEVYPACQLGGMEELFQSAMTGTLQMAQGDEGAMASYYEPFLVASIPYLFPNEEVGLRFYDSDFFQEVINKGLIENTGVRFLAGASYGFRCWTNNVRPLKEVKDFQGLKLRVMATPLFIKYVEALKGGATPISFAELYSALQQGVVDGQENPVSVIWDQRLYEVQKYLTVDEHVLGVNSMLINEDFYQSLPDDLKTIILTGARLSAKVETGGRTYQNRISILDILRKEGMEIYLPTAEEKELYKKASQKPVVDWLKTVIGEDLVQRTFEVVEAIKAQMLAETKPF